MECRICGSDNTVLVSSKVRHSHDPNVSIWGCKDCNIQFLYPYGSEKEILDFYDKDYRKEYTKEDISGFYAKSLPEAQQRADRVKGYLSPDDDILEIGCASGYFLNSIKSNVNKAFGCEWDTAYGNYAKEFGFEIKKDPWDFGINFNSIFMFHVLEHIIDPVEYLIELRMKLKDKGRLFIEVPNRNDALLKLYDIGVFKEFYYQSAHLWYFNNDSLAYVLGKAGFNCSIIPIQRYDMSNHLIWLRDKIPGGNGYFNAQLSDKLNTEYVNFLIETKMNDTIMAVATKK